MKLLYAACWFTLMLCASCKAHDQEKPYTKTPLLPLYFDICNGKNDCSVEYLKSINIVWYEEGQKYYENDSILKYDHPLLDVRYLPVNFDSISNTAIMDSTKPLLCSSTSFLTCVTRGVHLFYLEYPDHSIDTLFLDYLNGQYSASGNYYSYDLKEININGKVPSVDSIYIKYTPTPVYKIE